MKLLIPSASSSQKHVHGDEEEEVVHPMGPAPPRGDDHVFSVCPLLRIHASKQEVGDLVGGPHWTTLNPSSGSKTCNPHGS